MKAHKNRFMHSGQTRRHVSSLLLAVGMLCVLRPSATAALEGRSTSPDDPRWSQQWNLANDEGIGINVSTGWRYSLGTDTVIAILDTGVIPHPDIVERMLPGYDFVAHVATANDGNGRDADPTDPGDWVTTEDVSSGAVDAECEVAMSSWHGTHVAGIALASTNNSVGIAGIAPQALLLPVRVLGKCGGTDEDLIDGMRWAAGLDVSGAPVNNHPADIINLSLGSESTCGSRLQRAVDEIRDLGISIVAAAGNDGIDVERESPANCDGVISVVALTATGTLAEYSNHGPTADIAAPGGDSLGGIWGPVDRGERLALGPAVASYQGTSMAAAHVSGVIALARAFDRLTPSTVIQQMLFDSVAGFRSGVAGDVCSPLACGKGVVDAGRLLEALESRASLTVVNLFPSRITLGGSVEATVHIDGTRATDVIVDTPEVCTFDGATLYGRKRGSCMLSIVRFGTVSSKPLQYSVDIVVGGLTPTITHTLPTKIRVGTSARLNAIADSVGTLTYKSRTPKICKVGSAGKVTALSRGTCRVRIDVAASGDYDAGKLAVFSTVRR